jgi:hypothetical protein
VQRIGCAAGDDRAPSQDIDLPQSARYDTARSLTIASIREAEMRGDSAGVGSLAFRFGRVSVTLGHQAIARRELVRSIRLTGAARDTVNLAQSLLFRGFVHRDLKEFDEAMVVPARTRSIASRIAL